MRETPQRHLDLGFRRARARPDARATIALVRSRARHVVRTFMTTSREDARDAPRRCGAGGPPLERDTDGSPGARHQLAGPRAGQRESVRKLERATRANFASSTVTPRRSSEGNKGVSASRSSHRFPRRATRRASSTRDIRAGAAMTRCALSLPLFAVLAFLRSPSRSPPPATLPRLCSAFGAFPRVRPPPRR